MEVTQGEAGGKTPAQVATFNVQFAIWMLNVGRIEEANEAFAKALAILEEMDK